MDPSVQFYVVVEPGANLHGLQQIVRGFSHFAETRVRFVEGRSVSIFAQDNALAARDELGNPVLMIPRAFRRDKHREEDEISPEEAERNFGIKVVRSQFYWEGGNIIHDGHCCLIGVDTD